MIPERITRYFNSAIKHPERTVIAAISEITSVPLPVHFRMNGDSLPVSGKLPDSISRYMYLMEDIRDYEPETSMMIRHIVKPGNTSLVIGAHIGLHAILAKQYAGCEGVVIGFEPTPATFSLLEKNCKPRGIETEQLAITKNGVDTVEMTLFDIRHSAWNSGVTARTNKPERWRPKKLSVPATSIDSYCSTRKLAPDVLILDLENGEMDALLGGQNQISLHQPNIVIECGDLGREEKNNTHACLSLLSEWGYILFETDLANGGKFYNHELKTKYPDYYPNVLAIHSSKAGLLGNG